MAFTRGHGVTGPFGGAARGIGAPPARAGADAAPGSQLALSSLLAPAAGGAAGQPTAFTSPSSVPSATVADFHQAWNGIAARSDAMRSAPLRQPAPANKKKDSHP